MPIDRPYRQRFEGFFHERRSVAPRFSTAARNTVLTPYHYGGGFGTEPKAPHNLTGTHVGPRCYTPPTRHAPSATFGTARRTDVFGNKEIAADVSPVSSRRSRTYRDSSFHESHSPQRREDRAPGPQSYKVNRSDFEVALRTSQDARVLNAKFAQDGTHTPRQYIPGSKGGVIARSSRSMHAPSDTPGPAAYHPRYGLV